ncbi:hypothetical protein HUJ05_005404 [Dendroctonus ponderosae]|nr:hypothetical protein HUJ05_005404 [Dendroctonus ponderosae]
MAYLVQQKRLEKPGKESIHSGHFMVSQFEAEEQDDEDNVAVPIPEVLEAKPLVPNRACLQGALELPSLRKSKQQICIDQSLSKLFECMSLAYSFIDQIAALMMKTEKDSDDDLRTET